VARRGRSDRGAVLMLIAIALPVLIVMTAFAVDLGRQRSARRTMQARADVIALDLARLIDGRTENAIMADAPAAMIASAVRNGIEPSKVSYEFGTWTDTEAPGDEGIWQPIIGTGTPTAVRVRAQDEIDYFFRPGTGRADRAAVASTLQQAGFTIGSKLATVDTQKANILNGLLGDTLNTNLALSAATYQGLVGSSVNLAQLAAELGFASPEELADANVNAGELFLASAEVLDRNGNTAAANVLNTLAGSTDEDLTVDMGKLFQFDAGGSQTPALQTGLDVFNLVTGAAYAANGESAIGIPNVGVTVPGFTSSTLSLEVIQRAQTKFGSVGLQIQTQQARLEALQSIGTPMSLGGLLRVTGSVSLRQSVAGALGTLNAINCGTLPSISVGVSPQPVATSVVLNLTITLLGLPVAKVDTTLSATPTGDSAGATFDYPTEFLPTVGTGTMVESPTNPLGLADLLQITGTNVTLLGAIGVPLGTLLSSLNTLVLDPVLETLDPAITGPISTALGLSIGSADIGANDMTCKNVKLVG
jgi:uncharacterized membrane protein